MLKTRNIYQILLIMLCLCQISKAQDSVSFFQDFKNQYNTERRYKQQYYYNPANMLDYSFSSFSELRLDYFEQKDKIYRQQKGSGEQGIGISTRSFQKLNDRKVLWGSASYQNLKQNKIKWNENLDYNRVAPYISSDSVGGDIEIERYNFLGGYGQKFNQFSIGAQLSYQAQLGSRARDPRLNNTTSELGIKIGAGYNFYRNLSVDVFVEGNKYQQNSTVRFVNSLGQPLVYQMTGLGIYNSFFTGGASVQSSVHEEYSYKTGLKLGDKTGRNFYVLANIGQSNMERNFKGTLNRYLVISDLDRNYMEVEAAKFFQLNDHRLGLKANFLSIKTKGTEFGYSNNEKLTSLIYKRLSYKKEDEITGLSLYYALNKENFSLSFAPYYNYQKTTEQRILPYSGQKFEYNTIGVTIDYTHKIAKNQIVSFHPFFDYKSVISAKNALSTNAVNAINNWIIEDFNYLSSDITTIGANLRYDLKLEKLPAFFVSGSFIQSKIQSKNNNYSSVSLGITF